MTIRHLLAVSMVFGLLLTGCGEKSYTVQIQNNTAKTISYDYNGASETLEAFGTRFYDIRMYTPPPANMVDENGVASLKMNLQGDLFTIDDAEFFILHVDNTLSFPVTIKAENHIENKANTEEPTELTVGANAKHTTAKIYTSRPNFTSSSGYPVAFDWSISEEDEDGDEKIMEVTLR